MKKVVHILLICLLIPLAGSAREETLQERRTRIMRNYLRETNELSQIDWVLPDSSDEEAIAESEKFSQMDDTFERHTERVIPVALPRRRLARPQVNDEVLADDEMASNPYSDPFSPRKDDEKTSHDYRKWWEESRYERPGQQDQQNKSGMFSRDERYKSRLDTSRRGYQSAPNGILRQRQANSLSGADDWNGSDNSGSAEDENVSSLNMPRTYGSAPNEGLLLQNPSPTSSPLYRSRSGQSGNVQPGQIPFKYRRLVPELETKNESQLPSSPKYVEPLPYRQYRDRMKEWDPRADDAYVDELKRKVLQQ